MEMSNTPKWTPGPWRVEDLEIYGSRPDLYEALERIVKWMDAQGFNALYQDDTAIKDARAALAKSRGETK